MTMNPIIACMRLAVVLTVKCGIGHQIPRSSIFHIMPKVFPVIIGATLGIGFGEHQLWKSDTAFKKYDMNKEPQSGRF